MACICRTTATCGRERTRKKLEKAFAFMIRVRISGGVLTPKQWLALDEVARDLRQRHACG